jgi:hypothetical protein
VADQQRSGSFCVSRATNILYHARIKQSKLSTVLSSCSLVSTTLFQRDQHTRGLSDVWFLAVCIVRGCDYTEGVKDGAFHRAFKKLQELLKLNPDATIIDYYRHVAPDAPLAFELALATLAFAIHPFTIPVTAHQRLISSWQVRPFIATDDPLYSLIVTPRYELIRLIPSNPISNARSTTTSSSCVPA